MINTEVGKCLGCYEQLSLGYYHPKCAKHLFGIEAVPILESTTKEIESFTQQYVASRLTVTGVQRKLSLQIQKDENIRFTIIGSLGGGYILKPPSPEYEHMPENEDLTMHLAEICGIKVAKHGLLKMQDGEFAYVTQRFDRYKQQKIAVEDFCQLSEKLTEHKYRSSHEKIAKLIKQYSHIPGDDILRFFELVLFSFVTGNNDMHLKNFSMFTDANSKRVLTPAYDLLPVRLILTVNEDPEELALPLNGKKNKLLKTDFLAFAENLKIPKKVAEKIINNQINQCKKMENKIKQSFLPKAKQKDYVSLIRRQFERVGGD